MAQPHLDLSLIILPGKNPPTNLSHLYNEAFQLWKEVWEEASLELEEFPRKLYSNDFIRQDEILTVFIKTNVHP